MRKKKIAKLTAEYVLSQELESFSSVRDAVKPQRYDGTFSEAGSSLSMKGLDTEPFMETKARYNHSIERTGEFSEPPAEGLESLVNDILPKVVEAYKLVRAEEPEMVPLRLVWAQPEDIPSQSIARHHRNNGKSTIYVKPKASQNPKYLRWVVTHELIHYLFNPEPPFEPHNLEFILVADMLDIPEEYRD